MRIDRLPLVVALGLTADEAARLGTIVLESTMAPDGDSYLSRTGISVEMTQSLVHVLRGWGGVPATGGPLAVPGAEGVTEVSLGDVGSLVVRTLDGGMVVVMSPVVAGWLRRVVEMGFEVAGSRAEYYIRCAVSKPLVARIVAEFTAESSLPRTVSIPLVAGEESLDNPMRARPLLGEGFEGQSVGLVVRTTVNVMTGAWDFEVVSIWLKAGQALSEVARLDGLQSTSLRKASVSWHMVRVALFVHRPRVSEDQEGVSGRVHGWVVGRVVGQDVGELEVLPSSVWLSRAEADAEVARIMSLCDPLLGDSYQVWESE